MTANREPDMKLTRNCEGFTLTASAFACPVSGKWDCWLMWDGKCLDRRRDVSDAQAEMTAMVDAGEERVNAARQ